MHRVVVGDAGGTEIGLGAVERAERLFESPRAALGDGALAEDTGARDAVVVRWSPRSTGWLRDRRTRPPPDTRTRSRRVAPR